MGDPGAGAASKEFLAVTRESADHRHRISHTRRFIGLTENPRLVKNPLRLLVAGTAQILYELYWNKSWRTHARILFGTTDYVPPVSRDFALHSDLVRAGAQERKNELVTFKPWASSDATRD
jgi:hypothetical protein